MEVSLEKSIIDNLSSRGVLAYVAVKIAWGTQATTAALADLVRAQTSAMLEGLKELSLAAPGLVRKDKSRWVCGNAHFGNSEPVQTLESGRFQLFMDDMKKYWDFLNQDIPFEVTPADGMAIRRFLSNHRAWTQDEWRQALNNRKASVKLGQASRTEPFHVWMDKLATYAAGPLDRFYKPLEGDRHGKVIGIQHANREAGSRFLDRIRAREGAKGGGDRDISEDVRPVREQNRNGRTA